MKRGDDKSGGADAVDEKSVERKRKALKIAYVLLGGLAMLVMNRTKNATQDEAFALETSRGSIARTVRRAIRFEEQPPAYFVTLNLWRRLHPSLFFARTLSVLIALGYVATIDRIGKKNFSPATRHRLTALAALHPVTLFVGTETRAYGAAMLVSGHIVAMLLDRLAGRRGSSLSLILAGAASLCTQYYCGTVLGGYASLLTATGRWRDLRRFSLESVPIAALAMPFLRDIPSQIEKTYVGRSSPLNAIATAVSAVLSFVVPLRRSKGATAAAVTDGAFTASVATLAALSEPSQAAPRPGPGTALLLHALGVLGALQLPGHTFSFPQHAVALHPLFLVALAEQFDRDEVRGRRHLTTVVDISLALLAVRTIVATFYPGAKRGDWKRIGRYLEVHAAEEEPIFIFPGENIVALRLYFRRSNPVRPIPCEMPEVCWDARLMVIEDVSCAARLFCDVQIGQSCWFATREQRGYLDLDYGREHLEAAINQDFLVTAERRFFGSLLRRVERVSSSREPSAPRADP